MKYSGIISLSQNLIAKAGKCHLNLTEHFKGLFEYKLTSKNQKINTLILELYQKSIT